MKAPLVLLHGSNGSPGELGGFAAALQPRFEVTAPNLLGHGGRPVPDGYTLEEMADDLLGMLSATGPTYLFGYSLGGYLALYLARHHPALVRGVIAVAAKHVFDAAGVAHVVYLAQPERLGRPGNPRKAQLEQAHGAEHWERVTRNTQTLWQAMGARPPLSDDDLRAIATPVLTVSGDLDSLVSLGEFHRLGTLLPNARTGLFAGSAHPIGQVPRTDVVRQVNRFAEEVEAGRFVPGPELRLGSNLVAGGLTQGPSLKFAKDRQTDV